MIDSNGATFRRRDYIQWLGIFLLACSIFHGCNKKSIFPVEVKSTDIPPKEWVPIVKANQWGFETPDGQAVIEPLFNDITVFGCGAAGVQHKGQWYLMNDKGQLVIDETFDEFSRFSQRQSSGECIAVVEREVGGKPLYGYLKHTGKYLLQPSLEHKPIGFYSGYGVIDKGGRMRYIDLEGEVHGDFYRALPFTEGMARVQQEAATGWGFVNMDFELAINPVFEEVGAFSEGLAAARMDDQVGFIDREGKWEIQPSFLSAYNFLEGYAAVGTDEGWFLVDKEGERVSEYMTERDITYAMTLTDSGQIRNLFGPANQWKALQKIRGKGGFNSAP